MKRVGLPVGMPIPQKFVRLFRKQGKTNVLPSLLREHALTKGYAQNNALQAYMMAVGNYLVVNDP